MKQGVVWSKSKGKLGKNDEVYKINQVLMYGDLDDVKELIKETGVDEVRNIFMNKPSKIYTKEAFNFIKNYVLRIEENLDSDKYVKTLY